MNKIIEREMTISHREFFRLLPDSIEGMQYRIAGHNVIFEDDNRTFKILLSDETVRKLATLVLPVTHLRLELNGFTETEQLIILKRFDLAYQKGGG